MRQGKRLQNGLKSRECLLFFLGLISLLDHLKVATDAGLESTDLFIIRSVLRQALKGFFIVLRILVGISSAGWHVRGYARVLEAQGRNVGGQGRWKEQRSRKAGLKEVEKTQLKFGWEDGRSDEPRGQKGKLGQSWVRAQTPEAS